MSHLTAVSCVKTLYLTDKCESTRPLAVETHVLGVRLRQANIVPVINELPDGKCISVHVPRGKSLVGHVKKGKQLPLLNQLGQLFPLLWPGVDPSGIMGTSMEQNDTAFWDVGDVLTSASEIKPTGSCIVVPEQLRYKRLTSFFRGPF